jgi:hypothetical protein
MLLMLHGLKRFFGTLLLLIRSNIIQMVQQLAAHSSIFRDNNVDVVDGFPQNLNISTTF